MYVYLYACIYIYLYVYACLCLNVRFCAHSNWWQSCRCGTMPHLFTSPHLYNLQLYLCVCVCFRVLRSFVLCSQMTHFDKAQQARTPTNNCRVSNCDNNNGAYKNSSNNDCSTYTESLGRWLVWLPRWLLCWRACMCSCIFASRCVCVCVCVILLIIRLPSLSYLSFPSVLERKSLHNNEHCQWQPPGNGKLGAAAKAHTHINAHNQQYVAPTTAHSCRATGI